MANNLKKGFTLAEILITLGLLGCISAMTIPTLAYSYRGKVLEQQYKAIYSDLKEISSRMNSDVGDIGEFASKCLNETEGSTDNWAQQFMKNIPGGSVYSGTGTNSELLTNMYKSAGKPKGPFKFSSNDAATICSDSKIWLDLKSRIYAFNKANKIICIDINGVSAPNKVNIDIFAFKVMSASEVAAIENDEDNKNDYSGDIIPCNLNKISLSENSTTGCPFYSPMEDRVPSTTDEEGATTLEKSSKGRTLNSSNTYWKDYIDYR